MKLICSLGHCECDGQTVHKLSTASHCRLTSPKDGHTVHKLSTASHCRLTSPKDGHIVHKLSQRRLTADWLAPKTVSHTTQAQSTASHCRLTSPKDGHTLHKLSQRRLTADWLPPRGSDGSRMQSKVSSDWLPNYTEATRLVLEIFKIDGYFPDSPRIQLTMLYTVWDIVYMLLIYIVN